MKCQNNTIFNAKQVDALKNQALLKKLLDVEKKEKLLKNAKVYANKNILKD